ncbi:MAG: hypothetical protein JO048_13635 [Methylobacteriaceae bacterium]|nr:hypothetical protein [Methylobacteriaceae bacterium]
MRKPPVVRRSRARPRQFRLVDGVVIGAVALLALKVLGLFSPPAPLRSGELPAFARVLAHARTDYVPGDPAETGSVPERKPPPPSVPVAPVASEPGGTGAAPAASGPTGAERAIIERLGERREELQQRAREMETRQKIIEDQERRLEEKIGTLKANEDKRDQAATRKAEAEAAGLKSVVLMYETMKPKEAARVFDRLPQDVLVQVATQMNPRKMAEVLAAMSPDGAQKLTVALAKRAGGEGEKPAAPALPAGELQALDPAVPPARR